MQYFPALIILYNFWFYDGNGRERTRMLLTSAAYVHLKHSDLSKHTRNLSPASRAILLSGPTGMPFGNDYVFLLTCLCLFFFFFLRANLTACLIPTEPYHQMLAKALAHDFQSKLLLLDVTDFSIKVTRAALFPPFPLPPPKKKNWLLI